MRANEFIVEDSGATTSGGIAPVSMPIGPTIQRQSLSPKAKYANSYKTPVPVRKVKNAR